MFNYKITFTNLLQNIALSLFGFFSLFSILLFVVASIPVYLYRLLVTKLVSRISFLRPSDLGDAVSGLGNGCAVEFSEKSKPYRPSRQNIVINCILEGDVIPINEITEHIKNHWIKATDTDGNLMYPEFQQYIGSWLGFMFWKWEKNFKLEDHIHIHKISPDSKVSPEQFLCNFTERILNKPCAHGISPWDIHLVQFYKILCRNSRQVNQTAVILRIHHAMADGYSIVQTLVDGLCETKGLDVLQKKVLGNFSLKTLSTKDQILDCFQRILRIFYDMEFMSSLHLRRMTQWHIPDNKKSWFQNYQRSNLIPISTIKQIKCKFSVSFTAVLLSCLSAGLSKIKMTKENTDDKLVSSLILPLPGHSTKLRNEFTGTFLALPISPKVDPVTRLHLCEASLQNGKFSMIPHLLKYLFVPSFVNHVTPVVKCLTFNYVAPVALTFFRASDLGTLEFKGRNILTADFAAGTGRGVTGIGFMVLSYADRLRISATAEKSVLSHEELETLMGYVEDEMKILDQLSNNNR